MRHLAIATVLGLGLLTLLGCDQKSDSTTAPAKTDSSATATPAATAPATPAAPSDLPMNPTTAP